MVAALVLLLSVVVDDEDDVDGTAYLVSLALLLVDNNDGDGFAEVSVISSLPVVVDGMLFDPEVLPVWRFLFREIQPVSAIVSFFLPSFFAFVCC